MFAVQLHEPMVTVAVLLLAACGSSLPEPTPASHPRTAYELVQFPPPPARVELIPDRPRAGAVWIDGEWIWGGRRWGWQPGRWVMPIPGVGFARWCAARQADGSLFVAKGAFRNARGEEVPSPPALAVAKAGMESVVDVEGELEKTRPNDPPPDR
jgi:hypothetical protein